MHRSRVLLATIVLVLAVVQLGFSSGAKEGAAGGEVVTIIMERPLWSNADPASPPKVRIREAIKKAINIDVEVVGQPNPSDQYEKPNLMLAAGEPLDIFQVPTSAVKGWRKYKADGVIIPLNELLDKYGPDLKQKMEPSGVALNTDNEGKIWSLADEQPPMPQYILARKDWMDKQGVTMPAFPTIADYERLMEAFKKEGDVGFVPSWRGAFEGMAAGAYIPTANANYVDGDGKLKPYHTHPGFKDLLVTMKRWYEKGYLHKEYFTMTYQQFNELARGGKAGLFITWAGLAWTGEVDMLKKNVPTGDYVYLNAPKDKVGPMMIYGSVPTADIMITKSSKHPDAAMKFLNWSQATNEGWLLTKYGQEGLDYVWVDKAKGLLKDADKPAEDRYPYAIFASTRLLQFQLKFTTSLANAEGGQFANDPKRFPAMNAADMGVIYDNSKFKSKDQLTALGTLIAEAVAKVVMGQQPLAEWDAALDRWYKMGGNDYIDDITAQYKAQKK